MAPGFFLNTKLSVYLATCGIQREDAKKKKKKWQTETNTINLFGRNLVY